MDQALLRFVVRSVVAASVLSHAPNGQAQEGASSVDSTADIAQVVVTGSRIARPELDASAPIAVIGRQDFEAQGLQNFADLAATLPQFAPSFGASRTQSTFAGAQFSGMNATNLRNLTPVRTVVLINGRRVPGGSPRGGRRGRRGTPGRRPAGAGSAAGCRRTAHAPRGPGRRGCRRTTGCGAPTHHTAQAEFTPG